MPTTRPAIKAIEDLSPFSLLDEWSLAGVNWNDVVNSAESENVFVRSKFERVNPNEVLNCLEIVKSDVDEKAFVLVKVCDFVKWFDWE